MKLRKFLAICIAILAIVSCSSNGGGNKEKTNDDGTAINSDSVRVLKDYHSNGNIWHIKEVLNIAYPKKDKEAKWVLHGTVYQYYENPKNVLATKTEYVRNKKNGKDYKYYKNGKVYFERDYVNDRKEGMVKKYHESGYLISETPYKHDMLGIGTKEYNESGEELTMPELKVWTEDTRRKNGTFTIYASVVNKYGDKLSAEFSNGLLIDGKFSHPNLQKITKIQDKVAVLAFYESTGFPPFANIVAKAVTPKGTPVLLSKMVQIK